MKIIGAIILKPIMATNVVLCLHKANLGEFSNEDVIVGKLYELLEENAGNGMSRIIDESGEDYLYPSIWFEPITLKQSTAVRLHDALTGMAA